MLIDTHCHIHESTYPLDPIEVLERARQAGVDNMICVGTSPQSSRDAVNFAARHDGVFASIGVHPHDTKDGLDGIAQLLSSSPNDDFSQVNPDVHMEQRVTSGGAAPKNVLSQNDGQKFLGADQTAGPASKKAYVRGSEQKNKIVAIGEIGLDYFYTHSPREIQIKALEQQINMALTANLPIIFHVRDAFDDFWPIFDNFHGIRGELHSFTDTIDNMEQALQRGLSIGVNGISTFTKSSAQQEMFAAIPLDRLLLETDAPFLTPIPHRGKINEPAFVSEIANHHANIRGLSLQQIADATTANATTLFGI